VYHRTSAIALFPSGLSSVLFAYGTGRNREIEVRPPRVAASKPARARGSNP
jgi:hypothetical protein